MLFKAGHGSAELKHFALESKSQIPRCISSIVFRALQAEVPVRISCELWGWADTLPLSSACWQGTYHEMLTGSISFCLFHVGISIPVKSEPCSFCRTGFCVYLQWALVGPAGRIDLGSQDGGQEIKIFSLFHGEFKAESGEEQPSLGAC